MAFRRIYAEALYKDSDATLDDIREAVTTLEARVAKTALEDARIEDAWAVSIWGPGADDDMVSL